MTDLDIRDVSLLDVLPEVIAGDPEFVALSKALDPELRAVSAAIVQAVILPRIADLGEPVLDALAWDMRLTELELWDHATVEGKRALLSNIFAVRKRSGTRWAVRRVFDLLQLDGKIFEWWEEGAAPYTYRLRLKVGDVGITLPALRQIPELLRRFAPTRAQLSELAVEADSAGALRLYPALTLGRHTTIAFQAGA